MDTTVVALVVGVRFIAPLFILRFPLPAILVCLVADAVDQTIFQAAIGGDLSWYQSYDKAFDVYYLSFAFISTLTNWRDENAFQVSRILFFWRLIGVVLFELTHWRFLLLLFPNAFEYFFIAYEAIRTRWRPERLAAYVVVALALGITVFIKVPAGDLDPRPPARRDRRPRRTTRADRRRGGVPDRGGRRAGPARAPLAGARTGRSRRPSTGTWTTARGWTWPPRSCGTRSSPRSWCS